MPLETATYINGLVSSNPPATDQLSQADDHLRLIKSTILATFPSITGPVTATHAQLSAAGVGWGGAYTSNVTTDGNIQLTLQSAGTTRASWWASSAYSMVVNNNAGTPLFTIDQAGNTSVFKSDLQVIRTSAATNGLLYFGNTGTKYILYDGTNWTVTGTGSFYCPPVNASSAGTASTFTNTTGNTSLVSVVTPDQPYQINFWSAGASRGYLGANSSYPHYVTNGSGSVMLYADGSGNLTAVGNVAAYSDARLKTNVETVDDALEIVDELRGVWYTRIDSGAERVGLIAQEVREVLPEVVVENAMDGTLAISYGDIVGVLVEAIKELKSEVRNLQYKVDNLRVV